MKFGLKLFLAYFAIIGLGTWLFFNTLVSDLRPALRQSMESSLVDTANLLAEMVSEELMNGSLAQGDLDKALNRVASRALDARIDSHQKTDTRLRIYITDQAGIVRYDSSQRDLGADYSRWNDVYLTLQGKYGARSTLEDSDNPLSSVMYIAAPVYNRAGPGVSPQVIGVLSVGKPSVSIEPFWQLTREKVRSRGIWLLLMAVALGALLSTWLSINIRRLLTYARATKAGERTAPPKLHDPELASLAQAMEEMKQALDGKEYIEHYIHSLTHEMKSPLTALSGAAELIGEVDSAEQRQRFARNILHESRRMRQLVDKLLQLAQLENRSSIGDPQQVNLAQLIEQQTEILSPRAGQQQIGFEIQLQPCFVECDPLLLGQAIRNLLENALDFSPPDSRISVQLQQLPDQSIQVDIRDQGCGIPDYALKKIGQRFYSLPRPDSGQKSTGLGLSFVQEVVLLHRGSISVENHPQQGALARIRLPAKAHVKHI
ncbi:two-component system sensor histidine kinase CreC [Marinobacterium jannaschii]|uniref:two-component system sensor histidine kinase CreC n=1 Tax=Marinobacterium jannaschii TaxID=64970 RepID=UPI0004802803|nr:two-component system sensor histidine kinase CreC [Marinobacterium jannaschii]